MADTNHADKDKAKAIEDRQAIERFSHNTLEGWVDTPYVKVLFSEYYAQASLACATEYGRLLMGYDNRIRAFYSALEMKVLGLSRPAGGNGSPRSLRGLQREMNAINNFSTSIFEAIAEKKSDIMNWQRLCLALVEEYNKRIIIYIDDVMAVKTATIDYPRLDESDIPSFFEEELELVERQEKDYRTKVDQLLKGMEGQEHEYAN